MTPAAGLSPRRTVTIRRTIGFVILATLHAAAIVVLVMTEANLVAQVAFLFTWAAQFLLDTAPSASWARRSAFAGDDWHSDPAIAVQAQPPA
jgi:hypothetical protein